MAVSKINFEDRVLDFNELLVQFSAGKLYLASGSFTKEEADTAFATLASKEVALVPFEEISDLAEKPGKLESKTNKLKTLNYTLQGKRANTITLNLVGVSQARKKWLEEDLNKQDVTFCLESNAKDAVMLFNGLRWVADWSYEIEGLFDFTINTEFSGATTDNYLIYDKLN